MGSSSDLLRLGAITGAALAIAGLGAHAGVTFAAAAPGGLAGIAAWTLVEYLLHRFAFHLPSDHALHALGAHLHAAHHAEPARRPIVKPPALSLGVIALSLGAAALALGLARVAPIWCGLVLGYLWYELSHVAIHVLPAHRHPWPAQRRRHLQHHADGARWFGISSPLWDLLLATRGPVSESSDPRGRRTGTVGRDGVRP